LHPDSKIKAIFWDNDGVLVDTERLYYQATKQVLEEAGLPLTVELYVEFFLRQAKGVWHLLEEKGFAPEHIEQLRHKRNALYSDLLTQESIAIHHVENVLQRLHGKYLMGVVTSSRKDHFEVIHRTTGFLKYFDFVLTHGDYTKYKPDPEPYQMAVQKSGYRAEECIAVEDSERGLLSATAAGVNCVIIPNELTRACSFEGAYRILSEINEMLDLLS
jgi:HAD superfamily hydrolase (TIGR01509 family)